MRRHLLVAAIVAVVLANIVVLLIRTKRPRNDSMDRASNFRAQEIAEREKTNAIAYDMIAQWNSAAITPLDSEELSSVVSQIPKNGCIGVAEQAVKLDVNNLPNEQVNDLNLAITGLLQAYGENHPQAVISYMDSRDKQFAKSMLPILRKVLTKRGEVNANEMSGNELYVQMWKSFQLSTGWIGLAGSSSCLQVWDGRALDVEQISRFDDNPLTAPTSEATRLVNYLQGTEILRHHFAPRKGRLEDGVKSGGPVLLADAKLIIEFDNKHYHVRAPYMVRFWYNKDTEKWQPICMCGFAGYPGELALPRLMF